jgi:lambda family phage portal protein
MFVRQRLRDGEHLSRIRPRYQEDMPGLPPVKIQPMEADMLPVDKNETLKNGNRIINGVELNALDEIVAYHLFAEHPNTDWVYRKGSSIIPETSPVQASMIIHSYHPDRIGQLRGLPLITPCAVALWDFEGYLDSVRIAARAVANQVGIVTTPNPADLDDSTGTTQPGLVGSRSDSESTEDSTSEDVDTSAYVTDSSGTIVEEMRAGSIFYAPDGTEFKITDARTPEGIKEFVSVMLHQIAASVGESYHTLSGDMSDASFAQAKLGLIHEAQNWKARRQCEIVPQICTPLWRTCMAYAIKADLFRSTRPTPQQLLRLMRPTWSDPVMPSADRLVEAKAAEIELRAGLRSRADVVESNYNRDPDTVIAEYKKDKAARDEAGMVCSWDLSQVSSSGIWQESIGSSDSTTEDSSKK